MTALHGPRFWAQAHHVLASLFTPDYAGYKPAEHEAPNSDGTVDTGKRYLHIAPKYKPPTWAMTALACAHYEACAIAERIGVPDDFYPRVENGTLRVLEYPAGTGTAEHTDFDLFTVNIWRSTPEDHEQDSEAGWTAGAPEFHMGRIGAMIGLGPAVAHRVPARPYAQKALVYFAMPANGARLPATGRMLCVGPTVAEWLADVYAKSRVAAAPAY